MTLSRSYLSLLVALVIAIFSGAALAEDKPEGKKEGKPKPEVVTIDQVPDAVKATIEKETEGGTIKTIHKITRGEKHVYRVNFEKDGGKHQLAVAEDGTVIKAGERERKEKEKAVN